MKLNEEIQKIINSNKREQLIDAQFMLMQISGEISGNVKDVLYLEDIQERRKKIQDIKQNLEKLVDDIYVISDALRIDFEDVIRR